MSTYPDPVPDPTPPPSGVAGVRIGDAERNAAADALQQHLSSGRLTLDEYADRAAVVSAARTQGEVDQMFGDLPPIAGAPGAAGTLATSVPSGLAAAAGAGTVVPSGGNRNRALLIGLVSAMPFISLILFLITGQWWFFLLIPLVGAVLGPMIGNNDDDGNHDGGGRNRNRRR